MSNLSEEEKQRIRELGSQGLTAGEIAAQMGRNKETVREAAKRMALHLTPGRVGNPSFASVRPGRLTAVTARTPQGSLEVRRREAQLPAITIRLDPGAYQILSAAAGHRRKSAERLAADIVEGTCFLGSIPTQESKASRFRASSDKDAIQDRAIAESTDATPVQA